MTHLPEFEEILKDSCCNKYTVQHRVGEEEKEELVVGKSNTVVHPKGKKKFGVRKK